jgi:hypothetical protein
VAWQHGTLVDPETPAEPEWTPEAASVLDEAEEIVNAAGPDVVAEEQEVRDRDLGGVSWWKRFRPPFRRRGPA